MFLMKGNLEDIYFEEITGEISLFEGQGKPCIGVGKMLEYIHDMLLFSSLGVSDQVRHKPSCTTEEDG